MPADDAHRHVAGGQRSDVHRAGGVRFLHPAAELRQRRHVDVQPASDLQQQRVSRQEHGAVFKEGRGGAGEDQCLAPILSVVG